MSVTFFNPKNPAQYNDDYERVGGGTEINMSNSNARDLLRHLGLPCEEDLCGEVLAGDLEVVCRRALMVFSGRGEDAEIPLTESRNPGQATVVYCGRRKGYLQDRTQQLLKLAQERTNPEDVISWG